MASKSLTSSEVKDIVKTEIKKYISDTLSDEIVKMIKTGGSDVRKELLIMLKNGLTSVHKHMWLRKDVWQNDIK